MSTSNTKRNRIVAGAVVIVVGLLCFVLWPSSEKNDTEPEEPGIADDTAENTPRERRVRPADREKRPRLAIERIKAARQHEKELEARAKEAGLSTREQRRVTREQIVVNAIAGMAERGDMKNAMRLLTEHRALFPDEDDLDKEALDLVADCVQNKLAAPGAKAKAFVEASPDYRLNEYILKICGE